MTNSTTSTPIQWTGDELVRIDYRNLLASLNWNNPQGYEIEFRQPISNPPIFRSMPWYHGILQRMKVIDPDLVDFFTKINGEVARMLSINYMKNIETIPNIMNVDGRDCCHSVRTIITYGPLLGCQLQLQNTKSWFDKVMEIWILQTVSTDTVLHA